MVNSLQPPCSPGGSLLNLGSALGPHDLPTVVNDITPIATSAPHIPNAIFERIERSEHIASVRVTPDPKWVMLAGQTFDLVCHDSNPCLTLGASALISASLSRTSTSSLEKPG
jgi:hypothetical protein